MRSEAAKTHADRLFQTAADAYAIQSELVTLIRAGRDDPIVAGGLSVALDALQAEGVIVEWRRFPAIGLFFLQVATERAAVPSIFTAAQVEAFVFGSRAGLRAGRSTSAWNDQEAPAGKPPTGKSLRRAGWPG